MFTVLASVAQNIISCYLIYFDLCLYFSRKIDQSIQLPKVRSKHELLIIYSYLTQLIKNLKDLLSDDSMIIINVIRVVYLIILSVV